MAEEAVVDVALADGANHAEEDENGERKGEAQDAPHLIALEFELILSDSDLRGPISWVCRGRGLRSGAEAGAVRSGMPG